MLSINGERDLISQFHRKVIVSFDDIQTVVEENRFNTKDAQGRLKAPRAHTEVEFQLKQGNSSRFTLPDAVTQELREVFIELMGDRFQMRKARTLSKVFGLLILVAAGISATMLFITTFVALLQSGPSASAVIFWLFNFLWVCFIALIGNWLYRRKSAPVSFSEWLRNEKPVDGSKVKTGWLTWRRSRAVMQTVERKRRGVRPRYSYVLGWSCKVAGLLYWLVIASPATDGLHEILSPNRSYSQHEQYFWIVLWSPAVVLIHTGYRLCQREHQPKSSNRSQRPVVYLRPFEDDGTTSLQPTGMFSKLSGVRPDSGFSHAGVGHEYGRLNATDILMSMHPTRLLRMFFGIGIDTSEECIVRFFDPIAPIIAIGKPGEGIATPGANRMYVSDDDWQIAVTRELERAQAVVLQPGTTPGVRWELAKIRECVEPYRVLICLAGYWRSPQYEKLRKLVREELRVTLPRAIPYLDGFSFIWFESNWAPHVQQVSYKNPIIWPLVGDATDLGYTLQPFVQGMHGGDREPPRNARRFSAWNPIWIVAIVVAFAVLMLPSIAINLIASGFPTPKRFSGAAAEFVKESPTGTIHKAVFQSPRISLIGKTVPYQMRVPESLLIESQKNDGVEHCRKSPDKQLTLQVVAGPEYEDLSEFVTQRLKLNTGKGIIESKLESTRTVQMAGLDWTDCRIYAKLENGAVVREICRCTSNNQGTVIVIIHQIGAPEFPREYEAITEEILNSLQFSRPMTQGF